MVDRPPVVYHAIESGRGLVLLPGTALDWQGKHKVGSEMAFSFPSPTGSCSVTK